MSEAADGRTPEQEALAGQIEQTRQQLGETVEALAAKADVKGRAQQRAQEVKAGLRDKARVVKGKVTGQAGELRDGATAKAAAGLREYRVEAAAAVAALLLAWLGVRWLRN